MTAAAGSVSSPTGSATPRQPRGVGQDEFAVHDAAVAADLIDPGVLTFEEYFCEVDTTGGPSHGAVVCDQYGVRDADPNTAVAVDMDLERFRLIFRSGIEGYATAVDPANG